ncbi:YwqJ-related putative deaminase [Streptomyces caatingaensis]|uniref:YwqJ-related putative deaminase n=1 Tax=Streptomyces caatingaensis TaxID=1678637 RepID=UPI00069F7D73|nr:YwqJ-related putative deaminase [Streptomyces caatingaensis]
MGVVLPDKLAFVLDLIGVNWPNVDEDDYRDMATALRGFADDVDAGRGDSNVALNRLISTNRGEMTSAIEAHVKKLNGKHLHNLAEGGRLLAGGLDAAAVVVAGAKGAAIVQLGILAGEVAAAQAAAPVTLGLSELGALGGVAVTRTVVKRILKEAAEAAAQEVLSVVTGPVFAALDSMATDLVVQVVSDGLGAQDGIDLKQTLQAGKDNLKIASAGGDGGLILASAGGPDGSNGDLVFDEHEHNTFTGAVHDHRKHLHEKGGQHLHTTRHHFNRTRGRGSLAKAIEEVAEKAMKSLDKAQTELTKHLDDVGKGLAEAGKGQKKHDQHVEGGMKGVKHHGSDQRPADASGGGSGGKGGSGSGGSGHGGRSSGGGGQAKPLDPQPNWHGYTGNETRHHRGDALDVSHLSADRQRHELGRETRRLADKAVEKVEWPKGQVPTGKSRMQSGCAGALLHNGTITSHTSMQQKKISKQLTGEKRAEAQAAQTPRAHPVVAQMYEDVKNSGVELGSGHGKCSEVALLSDRLHQLDPTGQSIRTVEDARKVLSGAVIDTRAIGTQVDPDTGAIIEHGQHQPACKSCRHVFPSWVS